MEMRQDRTVIRIRLSRRTKNHLNSMYFGALAVGAELVVAAKAVHAIEVSKMKVDFVFKDFKVEFFKRAEGDVFFICDQGLAVEALVAQTLASGERVTRTFQGYGVVPSKNAEEKILQFDVTLSVKRRRS